MPIRQSGSGKSRPRRSVATRPRRSSGSRSGDEHLVGEVRQRERAKKLLFAQEPIDAGLYGFSGRLTGALLSHFHFVLLKHGPKGDPSGRAAVDRLTGFLDFGDPLNTPPRRLAPAREVARLVGKAGAANLRPPRPVGPAADREPEPSSPLSLLPSGYPHRIVPAIAPENKDDRSRWRGAIGKSLILLG